MRTPSFLSGISLACALVLSLGLWAQRPTDYVDPFIGTSNFGATNPGAVVPHGMVSVTPFNVTGSSTNAFDKDARWWSMPYAAENRFLTGFSHLNLSGVGCPELGIIQLMPATGAVTARLAEYGSSYREAQASPAYFGVKLDKYGIQAEMTATQRVGLSRYTFPEGKGHVLLNLGVGLTNETGGMLRIVNDREIEGWRMSGGFCYKNDTERPVFFVAQFSRAAKRLGVWKKMPAMQAEAAWSASSGQFKYYPNYRQEIAGDSIGAWMAFEGPANEPVLVKVGISYVSLEQARQNLQAEVPGFDFEAVRTQGRQAWDELLSKVEVEGGTPEQKTIFYTALYHTQIHPNVWQDVSGTYVRMESHQVDTTETNRYTVFSLWDTYRNLHPLMSLLYPEKQLNMARSMVDMYREHGWLPKWELNARETLVMEGDPAIPTLVDTYLRGLQDFDVELAYEAMVKSATTPQSQNLLRPDNDDYLKLGYVPLRDPYDNSVSHALEYYIADWNLAQLAKALGKEADHERFLQQSLRYRSYFDEEYNMIRPKLPNGEFLTPFDPRQGENFEPSPGFHEGNAWQYTFYVPHDVQGLMKLMGGKRAFVQRLQKVFDEGLFDMANEPDINYPYLFNYVKGEEWRTQREVRRLMDVHYNTQAGGIPGNDDCGTLSAWVIFSMMGLYPVCPGDTDYALSSPVFDRIRLDLDERHYSGSTLEIEVNRSTPDAIYIQRVAWNGKPYHAYFIPHEELVKGGTLRIWLGENPKK